jgi:hypothetical protein
MQVVTIAPDAIAEVSEEAAEASEASSISPPLLRNRFGRDRSPSMLQEVRDLITLSLHSRADGPKDFGKQSLGPVGGDDDEDHTPDHRRRMGERSLGPGGGDDDEGCRRMVRLELEDKDSGSSSTLHLQSSSSIFGARKVGSLVMIECQVHNDDLGSRDAELAASSYGNSHFSFLVCEVLRLHVNNNWARGAERNQGRQGEEGRSRCSYDLYRLYDCMEMKEVDGSCVLDVDDRATCVHDLRCVIGFHRTGSCCLLAKQHAPLGLLDAKPKDKGWI